MQSFGTLKTIAHSSRSSLWQIECSGEWVRDRDRERERKEWTTFVSFSAAKYWLNHLNVREDQRSERVSFFCESNKLIRFSARLELEAVSESPCFLHDSIRFKCIYPAQYGWLTSVSVPLNMCSVCTSQYIVFFYFVCALPPSLPLSHPMYCLRHWKLGGRRKCL